MLPSDSDLEIVTPRLNQVPMSRGHAAIMFPLLLDEKLYRFTGGSPPASEQSLAAVYASRESRCSPDGNELWLNWLIRQKEAGVGVGYTQATVHSTHAFVAWVVGSPHQGFGYASEAAEALVAWLLTRGAPRILACVHPNHAASQRVAKNSGLKKTEDIIDGEEVWALNSQE